jgi:hypothetical protein
MTANKSLQATPINREQARDGVQPAGPESFRDSAFADYVISPACLSLVRSTSCLPSGRQ